MQSSQRKKFHPDFLDEIKQRADIVEVVGGCVELKKAGKEFLGCCPFHNENTPSFTVAPHKSVAYCFGCSWGGDAIKFLMEIGRASFTETVLDLARTTGIRVQYEDGSTEYDYPDPLPRPSTPKPRPVKKENSEPKDYTVDEWRVHKSNQRLLSGAGDAAKALAWLENRGITREMVKHYRLGLEKRVVRPDQNKPEYKEEYWAIAIFIPASDRPGRFHIKKRVAPWLTGTNRPSYLGKWAQFGLPATIYFTHNPPDACGTRFCEGEWDAILLGELARQRGEKVVVCCSTSGAGTVPSEKQLERLPGQIKIFFDRDEAGIKGAQKLATALPCPFLVGGTRAMIAVVPSRDDSPLKGWDVSDAIQAGYGWEDFDTAPPITTSTIDVEINLLLGVTREEFEAKKPSHWSTWEDFEAHRQRFLPILKDALKDLKAEQEAPPCNESGIRFRPLRKSLSQLLKIFPELESEAGQDWLKMRRFTPDHTINSQYFDWESDKPGVNLAVKSGLGTGKTYHVHSKFLVDDNIGAVGLGYRNALLIQFTERGKNWHHLQQDLKQSKEDMALLSDPNSRISGCADSLIYFHPHHFNDKRLILDEIEGTFKHLYQSKTAVSFHRQVCKERMGEAITNSEASILLDGNLTDLTVSHAERISGKKFTKIQNEYKGNRGKISLYTGTLKFGRDEETGETIVTERRINDYSLLHKMMMDDSEPFICGSDAQEKLEAWHEILRAKGRKVFRLDGSNSNTPEAKKFLGNPVKYIQEHGIEIVLYSPTAESGLSIELEGYFKRGYFFFFGTVLVNEQTQFLDRLRDSNMHRFVFCQNQAIDSGKIELTAEHIQEAFLDYALACSRISLSDVSEGEKQQLLADQAAKLVQRSNDAHFQYECHLKAKAAFERNHLRKCLEYALHTAGYQVEVVAGFKASKEELEVAQKAVQLRKSEQMFKANPLTDEEASDKARKFDATPQEKTEVARHRLVSRLPGIENKSFTVSKTVTLPQASVDEIKSGKVSLETAQKLGLTTPETPNIQSIDLGHLPLNSLNNQGEGVPTPGGEEFNCTGGVPVSEGGDLGQNKNDQNLGVANSEAPTTKAIDLGHLPLNFLINQREGGPVSDGGEVEVVITETKPVFNPEFIRKVKYQDRAWLSKVELHFLVENPDLAKLLQQRRWYKKLKIFSDPNEPDFVKKMNLSTYKSDWLKVHTLLEMGIEFFLNPESRWSLDSPEALEFWEKGKDARRSRYIGITVGESNPCEYIGRVLDKLDVKRKCDRVRSESGEKIRVYQVNADYLSSPLRSAVFECVQQRIESAVQSDSVEINWDVIVENQWAGQNSGAANPESPSTQGKDLGHLPLNLSINQGEGVPVLDQLIEALALCESPADFAAVVEGYSVETINDAIALQDTQPRRQQLSKWYEQLSHEVQPLFTPPSLKVNDLVRFINPAALQSCRGFEGISLRILKIIGTLAVCLLPTGGEETFGLNTLVPAPS